MGSVGLKQQRPQGRLVPEHRASREASTHLLVSERSHQKHVHSTHGAAHPQLALLWNGSPGAHDSGASLVGK